MGILRYSSLPYRGCFLVFTHCIKHLYKEGMSLRQICDWCRLLWTCSEEIDSGLLEKWANNAGLMKEWILFASLAVLYLDIPTDTMPLYEVNAGWKTKAYKILIFILNCHKGSIHDTWTLMKIFPRNTIHFLPSIILSVNLLKVQDR